MSTLSESFRLAGADACMQKWGIEAEDAMHRWKLAHANDPCERCKATSEISIVATGSLARLTPLCARCRELLERETAAYWQGWEAGLHHANSQPWWHRLFGPKI